MCKYSVIVPVYKVEAVLPRCIDSILNQTVTDFELILIDDGSPDSSGAICNEYAAKDARVRVIHQENGGVSKARNAGLDAARGEYIVFVDSDDFVAKDLLNVLSKSDADFVITGFSDYFDNKIIKVLHEKHDKWLLCTAQGIQKYLKTKGCGVVWAKRYKKSIINDNKLYFREEMKFSEDRIFNNDYLRCACTAESVDWFGYYYCHYGETTLTSNIYRVSFAERNLWRYISYEQFKDYPDIQKEYISQTLYFAELEFGKISKSENSFKSKCSMIKNIISDEFFRKCLAEMPNAFPKDVRVFCRLGFSALIVMKYGR